jgi:hypothetical protein
VRETYVSLAERVQAQTGIPYILIDGTLAHAAEGWPARRGAGGSRTGPSGSPSASATIAQIDATLAEVSQDERPRVYLARGPSGLETGLEGSINMVMTPHCSGWTEGLVERPFAVIADNIERLRDGRPLLNQVHPAGDRVWSRRKIRNEAPGTGPDRSRAG